MREYLTRFGFPNAEIDCLKERAGGDLQTLAGIARIIDSYGYDHSWYEEYRVQSALVSCRSSRLSCINAALLGHSLVGGLSGYKRSLLAVHRRDPDGVECGHVVAVAERDGIVHALGKSNYPALARVTGPYGSARQVAGALARGYVSMRFTPLYFGFFDPQDRFAEAALMGGEEPLNHLSDWMTSNYQYAINLPIAAA